MPASMAAGGQRFHLRLFAASIHGRKRTQMDAARPQSDASGDRPNRFVTFGDFISEPSTAIRTSGDSFIFATPAGAGLTLNRRKSSFSSSVSLNSTAYPTLSSATRTSTPPTCVLPHGLASPAAGRQDAMAALELSKGRDVEYAAALALGLSGDTSRSEGLAGDLEQRFPEDTFAKFTYVPVLRGLAALRQGKPSDSVERLQIALPYELAVNGLNFGFYLGGLHSAYVRGEAFLAAQRYTEAASEFQKILDHRGIVGADPIGALAHLQLGRTYAHSADKTKAKAAYQDFLMLWKDADTDVPVLKLAKAEYAKLQ
jgi:tetratricopeptide (TPR) repeat protein